MPVKVRIEISPDTEEEIIIKCRELDEHTQKIRDMLEDLSKVDSELLLFIGNTEYYIKKSDILFFEISDHKVFAHTKDKMLRTEHKLFELEDIMPSYFVRISKSVIANVKLISSLSRELTGNGKITFKSSDKFTYFSRGYYKKLKDKIDEVRF